MSRWLSLVAGAAVAASMLSGCNNPVCGPGTKQVQVSGGGLQCQPVDFQASGIVCDADAGASIVGDKCVSTVTCGQGTTLVNGACIGTGGTGTTAPPCAKPASGKICVNGLVRDFLTNMPYTGAIHVALYDPVAFIMGEAPIDETEVAAGAAGYVFQDEKPPGLGLLAVVAGDNDITGMNQGVTFVAAASGAQAIAAGGIYLVDIYALTRKTVDGWTNAPGGNGWYASGGYLSKFYSDAKPDPTMLSATETSPVSGVAVSLPTGTTNPTNPATVYFSTDLSTLDPSLKMTSAIGAGISPPPVGNIATFSGSGGVDGSGNAITWETQQGGSAAHIIFISRFHPN